jgi:acyl-CoA thioester hydrolase
MHDDRTLRRTDYPHVVRLATRWMDNDVYGHVNNVEYYSYFDTVINEFLIRCGGLDLQQSREIAVCAESSCRYFQELAFPDVLEIGLRVAKLGNSSIRYELGIFREGSEAPAATGHFVHVFIDREGRRPVDIPGKIRAALTPLVVLK